MPPRRPRSSLLRTLLFSPLFLLQFQCRRVDAVTLPGGLRAVREDVAEMAAAVRAHDLGAHHAEGLVPLLIDRLLAGGRVERGPAAAGVVLRVGDEELGATAGTVVCARLEHMVVLARERALRALFAEHVVLLGRQFRPPLLLCFLDLCHRSSVS